MRPCNQCRRPVENDVFICEVCREYNETHGTEPPPQPVGMADELPDVPTERDFSYTAMVLFFNVLLIAIGALLGLALFGPGGVMPGGVIGLFLGAGFLLFSR